MSQVIYARVPDELKEATDGYAASRGVTLTSAVVDLLQRGLAATTDEKSVTELEARIVHLGAQKFLVDAELAAARTGLGTVSVLAKRAGQTIGNCPNAECERGITGYDLIAVGQCAHCGQGLSELFAPAARSSTLDQREFMLLIGALGALLGVAILISKGR